MKLPLVPGALAFSLAFFTVAISIGAEDSPFETVVFEDDFSQSGPELKEGWGSWKSESVIRDGVLVGITPKTADHPSVNQIKLEPLSDMEVALKFKFAGSKRFSVMFRDLDYKGSHAGHICHVAVSDKSITLFDGKTGTFRKDIRDKRKARQKLDAVTEAMLKEKTSRNPIDLDPDKWHDLVIRIEGDTLRTWIDGKQVGELKSEGIAHRSKSNMNITTVDREVHYDDFSIKVP